MNLGRDPKRDRRALILLGLAVAALAVFRMATAGGSGTKVVAPVEQASALELRLRTLRRSMARLPGKQEQLKQASAELAEREKGLIDADTVNQAQAQVLDIVRRTAKSVGIDVRGVEFPQIKPYGDYYGEIGVTITAECGMEQLVDLMGEIAKQPQLLATSDLRANTASAKMKTVNVRLTISGLVPHKFMPEKKA